MEFEVKLFDTTGLAADGSNIPRRSCEEYLTSQDYTIIIRDKLALGGVTHKDRRLKPELKGIVGMDDQVLINDNATHYITKLYFKPGDNFFYASAETFDPDLFAGKRKENIINLLGLLRSGVRLPISVVIQALWSKRGVAEKIIRIKGFDFTNNPSFKGAGDIQFFSEIVNDPDIIASTDEIKNFSNIDDYKDCELQTRIYSWDGSYVILPDDTNLYSDVSDMSYEDIVKTFGVFSDQAKKARSLSNKSSVHKDVLLSTAVKADDPTNSRDQLEDDVNLDYWTNRFRDYTETEDPNVIQQLFRGNRDNIRSIVRSVPVDDPNRDKLILTRLNQFFRINDTNDSQSSFSTISSISDRLRNQQQPRYTKIDRIIKTYQQYWISRGSKLSDAEKTQQKLLFLQDINLLIKEVLPLIYDGKSFNSLYGLNRYGDEVKNSALELTNTYRKLLVSQKIMKFVPKSLYGEWMIDVRNLYKSLVKVVFNEELTNELIDLIDLN